MINKNTKISIIIPTYNRALLLREAILSILKQNYKNFEIIIIDDGSSDDTKQAVKSIKDKRIIYLYQKNRGRSIARNNGIEIATGKYLAFLDDDDLFLDGKLKKQADFLESHREYGMVYTSAYNIDENNNISDFVYLATKSGDIYKDVAFFLPLTIILPSVMVRKDIVTSLNGFDEKMNRFEDTDMWRRIAKRYKIYAIKKPLVKVLAHQGNRMEHPNKLYLALVYYVEKIFKEDRDKGIIFLRRRAGVIFIYYAGALFFQKKEYRKFIPKFILKSLYYWPSPSSVCFLLISRLINKIKIWLKLHQKSKRIK